MKELLARHNGQSSTLRWLPIGAELTLSMRW
jgi:hypothetical protein